MRRALNLLHEETEVRVVKVSFLYKTTPVGYTSQRNFLNGAVEIRTSLPPLVLLSRLQAIEKKMGKRVLVPDGPRKIDIDVLLFGNRVLREKGLVLPHPRLQRRKFVLVPLNELASRQKHPVTGMTIARMLRDCSSDEEVIPWGEWDRTSRGTS